MKRRDSVLFAVLLAFNMSTLHAAEHTTAQGGSAALAYAAAFAAILIVTFLGYRIQRRWTPGETALAPDHAWRRERG